MKAKTLILDLATTAVAAALLPVSAAVMVGSAVAYVITQKSPFAYLRRRRHQASRRGLLLGN